MQSLATDVGGLKKVLSNVSTRGAMGEIQAEKILQQILAPAQYSKNVKTHPDCRGQVEFAIKLPGIDGNMDEPVWRFVDQINRKGNQLTVNFRKKIMRDC